MTLAVSLPHLSVPWDQAKREGLAGRLCSLGSCAGSFNPCGQTQASSGLHVKLQHLAPATAGMALLQIPTAAGSSCQSTSMEAAKDIVPFVCSPTTQHYQLVFELNKLSRISSVTAACCASLLAIFICTN